MQGKDLTLYVGATGASGFMYTHSTALSGAWTLIGTNSGFAKVFDWISIGLDGVPYVNGGFSSIDGVSAVTVAKRSANVWQSLSSGLNKALGTPRTYASLVLNDGRILFLGDFNNAGGIGAWPVGLAIWNGNSFNHIDVTGLGTISGTLAQSRAYGLFIGGGWLLTATTSVVTPVTNSGSVQAYPKFTFTGPGTLYTLINYSTDKKIDFNLKLNGGEIAILDFSNPQNVQFYSNQRSNLLGTIMAGSDLDFFLRYGINNISLLIAGSVNVNTAASMSWRNTYHSIDGALNLQVVN